MIIIGSMFIMSNVLSGYLQSLGADLYHSSAQSASHIVIPALQLVVIIGTVVGAGLIAYDFYLNRKKTPSAKELAREVRKQQNKEELEQIDRQNNHQSERDDKFTPANIK
jgi:hypothetical protein